MPYAGTSTWSRNEDSELARLVGEGFSFSQVALKLTDKFGRRFTRNSCCGRAHRMGVKADPVFASVNLASRARPAAKPKPDPMPKQPARVSARPTFSRDQSGLRVADVAPLHLSVLDLQPTSCRWPYGDGPFTFCGHACVASAPYCEPHASLSVGEGSTGERAAHRVSRRISSKELGATA